VEDVVHHLMRDAISMQSACNPHAISMQSCNHRPNLAVEDVVHHLLLHDRLAVVHHDHLLKMLL
jgi:hypothetical protein